MPLKSFKTYPILRPISWLYRCIMDQRNRRFETGKYKIESFPVPVISVGNLSVGGTGKTPMCGYLLQLLRQQNHTPALLSRGYGRKNKGYVKAKHISTAADIGDEPLELYNKFQHEVPVYVCEKRCEGARQILTDKEEHVTAIVLDDAYQHRYIHRDINIMLTDYARLFTLDKVIPEGRLREHPKGADRADIIVVTKCPHDLTTEEADSIRQNIAPKPHQHVFFTTILHNTLIQASPESTALPAGTDLSRKKILIFTGIAKPTPLIEHYKAICPSVNTIKFPDHHAFTSANISNITSEARKADIVITTAKDYQRLPHDIPQELRQKLMVQRIDIEFLFNQAPAFDSLIMEKI